MQNDLGVDMDRNAKSNPGPKASSSNSKTLGPGVQQERQKDPQACSRYPRKNKPYPQKNQSYHDKRPQTRGFSNTETYRGKTAYEASAGYSAFCDEKRQKKVNLNHLLNFTYEASAQHSNQDFSHARRHQVYRTTVPRYNKELYLQATCQFIVKQNGDYTVHSFDPDHPVEWDLIEQVKLSSPQVPSCPICLYPPTAGKIAKCGHVFCYSCILHYLALSDKAWRKCPICYDPVDRNTLKSLTAIGLKEYNVGDEICLRLMRRERNSTNIFPVENYFGEPVEPMSIGAEGPRQMYAKVLTASPEQVLKKIVLPEQEELKLQLDESKDEPEACFIEEALKHTEKRIEMLLEEKNAVLPVVQEVGMPEVVGEAPKSVDVWESTVVSPQVETVVYASAFDDILEEPTITRERNVSESSCGVDSNPDSAVTVEDIEAPTPKRDGAQAGARSKLPKTTHYFYQCADGQNVYMHSLNIQMLIDEYGGLEYCPPVIKVKIVELESATMHAELRAKLRYLQHLPISAQFQVAEVKLGKLISRETFEQFRDRVFDRERRRTKRARNERLREKRIKNQEAQSYGPPTFNYGLHESLSEPLLPPSNFDEDFAPLPSAAAPKNLAEMAGNTGMGHGGMSFATMLKEGKQQQAPKPVQESQAPSGVLTLRRRVVTGSDDDDEDLPAPLYRESLGDAIAIALERVSLRKKTDVNDVKGAKPVEENKSQKKKKNNKGVVLFQTSMARGSGK